MNIPEKERLGYLKWMLFKSITSGLAEERRKDIQRVHLSKDGLVVKMFSQYFEVSVRRIDGRSPLARSTRV